MMASASSEFIALCQSQLALLTQTLGATSTVIYLAESSPEQVSPTLVPLTAYPKASADANQTVEATLSEVRLTLPEMNIDRANLLDAGERGTEAGVVFPASAEHPFKFSGGATGCDRPDLPPAEPPPDENEPGTQQLVLPLAHEGVMLGVMVSTRNTPPWDMQEYQQAEHVANTLAIACVMDQRGQWLRQQLRQRQLTQELQSETFHDLLHQFRNPLTAIQTFGKLLLKRLQTEDPNQPIAQSIVRESQRLQDLAQNFDQAVDQADSDLVSTTSEAGSAFLLPGRSASATNAIGPAAEPSVTKGDDVAVAATSSSGNSQPLGRDLVVEPGQMADVIHPLLLSATAIAQEKGMELYEDIPPELPAVWMDAGALREVLSNLLDNAIKYSPPGALIWVTGGLVQSLEGQLFQGIAVGDTGSGIPVIDQAQIFQRHYRGVQASSNIPGTGLGLAIVQELVQAMGGHIDLISPVQFEHWLPAVAPTVVRGAGTLFIAWLPTV
jgi:signal transduction histidine kinase